MFWLVVQKPRVLLSVDIGAAAKSIVRVLNQALKESVYYSDHMWTWLPVHEPKQVL